MGFARGPLHSVIAHRLCLRSITFSNRPWALPAAAAVYQYGFQFYKMGYACAAAYVLFILVFIVSLIQNISSKKWADLT